MTTKAEGLSPTLIAAKDLIARWRAMSQEDRVMTIVEDGSTLDDLLDAVERIASLAVQAQWQPIETAPKDGTFVLIAFGNSVGEARWVEDAWYWANNDPSDLWGRPVYEHEATHWMPLPAPPQAERPPEETR